MDAAQVLAIVMQLIALYPKLEPPFVQAMEDFRAMLSGGNTPTQNDIDALLERANAQSAKIQALT